MAGGLTEDKKAKASIKAANAIAYKTELRPEAIKLKNRLTFFQNTL